MPNSYLTSMKYARSNAPTMIGSVRTSLTSRRETKRLERSLIDFFKDAWPQIDLAPLMVLWHHEAIAEHLTAVAKGQIRKLLITARKSAALADLIARRQARKRFHVM